MEFKTLLINEIPYGITVTLNRIVQRNALNSLLLSELIHFLNQVENNSQCKVIVLRGQKDFFCTGMDFNEVKTNAAGQETLRAIAEPYKLLLERFASISKVIIAEIDGLVMAGGVGLVAASDIAVATKKSQFVLTEALWGLLPANVLPYLIRRVGFQKAYAMTLTTQNMTAEEAYRIHLIDELNDQTSEVIRKLIIHLSRLDEETISDIKKYFHKLWIIDDVMQETALLELMRLLKKPKVQNNIKRFIDEGKFPWTP